MRTPNRRQVVSFAAASLAASALPGCAGPGRPDPDDPTRSLVFGYIDMSGAPTPVDWVSLRCYTCADPRSHYQISIKDGLILHPAIQPGSYQIDVFGGSNSLGIFSGAEHRYNFGTTQRNDSALRIDRPGAYFLGAWRYVAQSGRAFSMQPLTTQNEKDLLARVVASMRDDQDLRRYGRGLVLAQQRLAQLR